VTNQIVLCGMHGKKGINEAFILMGAVTAQRIMILTLHAIIIMSEVSLNPVHVLFAGVLRCVVVRFESVIGGETVTHAAGSFASHSQGGFSASTHMCTSPLKQQFTFPQFLSSLSPNHRLSFSASSLLPFWHPGPPAISQRAS
jgi:hypothetical protein